MSKIKTILKTSAIKTFIFNFHYFGLKHAINPIVLLSRKVKLKRIDGNIIIKNKKTRIKIGYGEVGVFDSKYNRVVIENAGVITFKGNASIGNGTKIVNYGNLTFGDNFNINSNASIVCYKNIEFGDDCLLSWNTLIMDTDFHKIYDENKKLINENKPIIIGNNVWICCNTTILKGVSIKSGNVIAANSIVTKNLEVDNSIYVSNKVVKKNITWKR